MATKRMFLPQSLAAALIVLSFLLNDVVSAQAIPKQNPKPRNYNNYRNRNAYKKPTAGPTTAANLAKKKKSALFVQEFLAAHNMARLALGHKPMTWNYTLAYFAKQWAKKRVNDCELIHSYGPYGENLFWGGKTHWTPAEVVKFWVEEQAFYDPMKNKCVDGQMCGHYTQIVWKDSVRIGCARVNCNGAKGMYVICNYDPPGNYVHEHPFGPNWKPSLVAKPLPVPLKPIF